MNRKRIDLPWEVCGWIAIVQKSAEAIVSKERAISRTKGKDGSLTDKLKGRMLEWQRN